MTCAVRCMKCILVSFNLLFVIVGLLMIVSGTWAILNISSFLHTVAIALNKDVTGSEIYQNVQITKVISYIAIIIGVTIFIVAFLGCCGVMMDSRGLLVTYAAVVSILFLSQMVGILFFLIAGEKLTPIIIEEISETFSQNYKSALGLMSINYVDSFSQIVDKVMLKFECCGIHGLSDFEDQATSKTWHEEGRYYVGEGQQVYTDDAVLMPPACCKFNNTKLPLNITYSELHTHMVNINCPIDKSQAHHSVGCVEQISESAKEYVTMFTVIPISIAVLEIIGVILAGALAYELKREAVRVQ